MRALHPRCINIAVVGVNHEPEYVSYEGEREYRHRLRPSEAARTEVRVGELEGEYEGVLTLAFRATNQAPEFPFAWVDETRTRRDYGALLVRVGSLYDERFK
jgi:hypothetical protein